MKRVSEPSISTHKNPVLSRLVFGVGKLASVLKNEAWISCQEEGLTPTQGQILVLLRGRRRRGLRLSEIADELRISPATASDAVAALVAKGLAGKHRSPDDGRAIAIRLTREGRQAAWRAMQWSNFMVEAFQTLSEAEQEAMLSGFSKVLHSLHGLGRVPTVRMCLSCEYFEPNASHDPDGGHRCAYGDFAIADVDLRLDCSAHSHSTETGQS